jgi:CheY-like chemotaxis protein
MFTLIDTGCGIKEQEKTKVWNPFYQIDDQWMTNQKGLGLGLSNAKMLCKELGGDIYFINNPYNKGTAIQFYIKNHITKIKRDLPEIPTQPTLKIDISAIDIDISRLYPKYDNFKILIIEDHSMNAELLKLMLESNFKKGNIKNEIDVITDSKLVIEKLLEFQTDNFYDTIYMDLKMPTLSGFELLTLINENEVLSKIYNNRIILITALANDKATVKLKANPLVNKILFKPIQMRNL